MDGLVMVIRCLIVLDVLVLAVLLAREVWRFRTSSYAECGGAGMLKTAFAPRYRDRYRIELLLKCFDGDAKLLFNVAVPGECGETATADAVAVLSEGVVVFSVYERRGALCGRMSDDEWEERASRTASASVGRRNGDARGRAERRAGEAPEVKRFPNPVAQGGRRAAEVARYLGIDENLCWAFVLFPDECSLAEVGFGQVPVAHIMQIPRFMHELLEGRPAVFDEAEAERLHEALRSASGACRLASGATSTEWRPSRSGYPSYR